MGAWGSGLFENDDAADWAYEFERLRGKPGEQLGLCQHTIRIAAHHRRCYASAVAACEAYAWFLGRGKHDTPGRGFSRAGRVAVPNYLLSSARQLLALCQRQPLGWRNPLDHQRWNALLLNLARRLNSPRTPGR